MQTTLLFLGFLTSVGTYSRQTVEKTNEQIASQTTAESPTLDSILRDTITNQQGVKLAMAYNKDAHTATFVLNGEEIELKQDTLASGIKYRNAAYEYTEHQGVMILKKNGQVIFRNKL